MIDIMGLRQSYERRKMNDIRWIDGACNPADAMTKGNPCSAMKDLITTNQVIMTTKGWVDRAATAEEGQLALANQEQEN